MKKSIWIFLFAVLLPGFVLGWLALRSAEEQQIIFERRTAELYQKETEALAASAREVVETERRAFGDAVHRLLARSDADALARDFTNSLMDAWPRKAIGFVLGPAGEMLSPSTSMAANDSELRDFLWNNGSFLCSTQPAVVYPVPIENAGKSVAYNTSIAKLRSNVLPEGKPALSVAGGPAPTVLAQKGAAAGQQPTEPARFIKAPIPASPRPAAVAENLHPMDPAAPAPERPAAALAGSQAPQPPSPAAVPATRTGALQAEAPRPSGRASTAAADRGRGMRDKGDATPEAPALPPSAAATRAGLAVQSENTGRRRMAAPEPTSDPAAAPMPDAAPASPAAAEVLERAPKKNEFRSEQMANATQPAPGEIQPAAAPQAPESQDALMKMPAAAAGALAGTKTAEAAKAAEVQKQLRDLEPRLAEKRLMAREAIHPSGLAREEASASAAEALQEVTAVQQQAMPLELSSQSRLAGISASQSQASYFGRAGQDALNRMVEPQQQTKSAVSNWSAILPSTADFRALTEGNDEGMLARFVQDKLDLIFWIRPPESPEMVFGCLIEAGDLEAQLKDLFSSRVEELTEERPPFVLALLNDKARPVATFPAAITGRDWKRPFVANEIGEVLPHWEAALYLATPTAMADTARGLRRTLSFTIAGAIALIAIGGWLVVHDVRRQLALAQQKTDFVSNVSHELKTPLTSIRMFAELMHDRPPAVEKQGQYLRIIRVEAERLTRLINNVLDFAKLERRQRRFDKRPLDLCNAITRVWEGQEMHLRDAGFATRWEAAPGPYPVLGDEDALAQILVNLLSNAEKYSQEQKDIELVTWIEAGWVNVSVLDRGIGVPDGEERKIFEAFYRAHDSLSSGIQGSGLGLTLAQRVAREHGGEIVFERRQGGGSRFTLRLPLVPDPADRTSRSEESPSAPA